MPAEKRPLAKAMSGLKQALGADALAGPEAWVRRVSQALDTLEQSVRQHRATLRDAGGRVVEVDSPLNPSPGVTRRADELGKELDNLLGEIQVLRGQLKTHHIAAQVAAPPTAAGASPAAADSGAGTDWSVFRGRAERLVEGLGHFSREEAELIEETLTMDLGAGD